MAHARTTSVALPARDCRWAHIMAPRRESGAPACRWPRGVLPLFLLLGSVSAQARCEPGFTPAADAAHASCVPCGDASVFCPDGVSPPLQATDGWYTIALVDYVMPAPLPRTEAAVDARLAAAGAATRSSQRVCPPGTYCSAGVAALCSGGRASSTAGATTCAEECEGGYFCPPGSHSTRQHACGNETYFCPVGSWEPRAAPAGYYTLGGAATGTALDAAGMQCGGLYAQDGLAFPAAARPELPTSECVAATSAGTAAAAVADPLAIPQLTGGLAVTACEVPRAAALLGTAAVAPAVSRYRACVGGQLGAAATRTDAVPAEPGYWAWFGLRLACPPGRYGDVAALISPSCSGQCSAGFACGWASTNSTMKACGGLDFYCPAGSGAPTPVDIGYYTPADEPMHARTRQAVCEPGYWCAGGVRRACPAGRYGAVAAQSSAQCSGPCAAGYWCPPASTSATEVPCGSAGVYCPPGSAKPIGVSPGHYTVGGYAQSSAAGGWANATRWGQLPCEAGFYCVSGVRAACPAGTFGADARLSSPDCSGPCQAGWFCPPGSTAATEWRCGDLYLALVDVLAGVATQAGIAAGPFTDAGDGVTMADPAYDPAALAALYAHLRAGVAVRGGPAGLGDTAAYAAAVNATAAGTFVAAVDGPINNESAPHNPADLMGPAATAAGVASELQLSLDDGRTVVLALKNVPGAGGAPASSPFYRASLPWDGGVRWRLPELAVPVDSFAATHRLLLRGGPFAVYCPQGSGFPSRVPLGHYSITTPGSAAALVDPIVADANATRDGVAAAEAGYYAVAGVRHPCAEGRYGNTVALHAKACSGFCPAGHSCPLATAEPVPCPPDSYAPGGNAVCLPCPGAPRTEPLPCQHARSCCGR
jgi:hypothetical protein